MSYLEGGFIRKYLISKINGKPIDPEAKYFVLRYDAEGGDPHALAVLYTYVRKVRPDNPQLAQELFEEIEKERIKRHTNEWKEFFENGQKNDNPTSI